MFICYGSRTSSPSPFHCRLTVFGSGRGQKLHGLAQAWPLRTVEGHLWLHVVVDEGSSCRRGCNEYTYQYLRSLLVLINSSSKYAISSQSVAKLSTLLLIARLCACFTCSRKVCSDLIYVQREFSLYVCVCEREIV